MIYLIGGASRSGKTTISKLISIEKKIPYLSIDWIMMGFTKGIPEFGVHDKLMPDDIAKRLWSFLKAMIESMLSNNDKCIIEGEALLPELVDQLIEEYPEKLKVCFIGFVNVEANKKLKDIRTQLTHDNDWLNKKTDNYILDHINNMVGHSRMIKELCEHYKMRYFDTSSNFSKTLEEVKEYLTS